MTEGRKETPGMAEVGAKFEHEAEATAKAAVRKARHAVNAAMNEVGPIGDDETLIQNTYRKVLALRAARPRGLPDEAFDEWTNEHDLLEEKIGTFPAENLRDVEFKLSILCDRLRESLRPQYSGDANDLIIALAARDDLGRLASQGAPVGLTAAPNDGARITALLNAWHEAGSALCDATEAKEAAKGSEQEPLKEKEAAAGARESQAWKAFLEAPCQTFADVRQKLRPFQKDFKGSTGGRIDDLLAAVDSDLERLSRRVTVAAPSSASDPVAQIGRDLASTWRRVEWNDENPPPDGAPAVQKNRFKRLDFYLVDRWGALEAMAAEEQAGSLEGAMIQIMLAHAEADLMMASTEESSEVQMRTIGKLLYSALAAIEQVAGVPREELGGEHYMCRDLDPHALVAETGGEARP